MSVDTKKTILSILLISTSFSSWAESDNRSKCGTALVREVSLQGVDGKVIADHSNGSVKGSIQYHLDQPVPKNRFLKIILKDNGTYPIRDSLKIKQSCIGLYGKSRNGAVELGSQQIRPSVRVNQMILIAKDGAPSNISIKDLSLQGDGKAIMIIKGMGTLDSSKQNKNIFIRGNTLRKTFIPTLSSLRNDDAGSKERRPHGIDIGNGLNIQITDNRIFDIGIQRETKGERIGIASGIRAYNSDGLVIKNNVISNLLGGGIEMSNSVNVVIDGNNIYDATMKYGNCVVRTATKDRVAEPCGLSDGINGYHNTAVTKQNTLNWKITNNKINNVGNNGIHVSGKGIELVGNTVSNTMHVGINVSDWRQKGDGDTSGRGRECSSNVKIDKNIVSSPGRMIRRYASPDGRKFVGETDIKPGTINHIQVFAYRLSNRLTNTSAKVVKNFRDTIKVGTGNNKNNVIPWFNDAPLCDFER